jgi:PAS domain S-box-containing protein
MTRKVAAQGAQLILRDVGAAGADGLTPFGAVGRPSASLMFVPVRHGERVAGILSIQSYTPRAYDAGDLAVLQTLADHCGSALERLRIEEALRESRAQLVEAHRLARMGVWTWHMRERRADWSDELFRVFGMAGPDAPTLEQWRTLVVPEDRDALIERLLEAMRADEPFHVHFRFRRPNGIVAHIRAAGDSVRGEDGRIAAVRGFAQDVTEVRRAEAQQRAVAQLGQLALSGAGLDELFDRAVGAVADVMLVEQAVLTERLEDGSFLIRAGRGWREGAVGRDIVPGTGQSGYTLATGAPVVVEDWAAERRFAYSQLLRDVGVRSGAAVPVGGEDQPFGVLGAQSVHLHHFTPDDVNFLQSVANVLAAAIERRRAAERIGELAEARQRLVAQALDAEERTRRIIADTLHDGPLQEALILRLRLSRLRGPEPAGDELDRVRDAVERMAGQLRDAMLALHPAVLQARGLEPALQAVAEQQAERGGFTVDVSVDPAAVGVRDELILSLARELLVNATKHAGARHVRVAVRRQADGVELVVADDGAGIAAERLRTAVAQGHIGLASSAERVEALGGRLSITGAPGQGTVATARLPG